MRMKVEIKHKYIEDPEFQTIVDHFLTICNAKGCETAIVDYAEKIITISYKGESRWFNNLSYSNKTFGMLHDFFEFCENVK